MYPARPALDRGFFDRPTRRVALALLGATIAHGAPEGRRAARIVETEAYLQGDPASHAFAGPTRRNRSMFGRPGTLYVYRIHQVVCANVVTRPGEAVLLRSGEPLDRRGVETRGPGRLCRALGITLAMDGTDLTDGPVRLFPGGRRMGERVVRGPRVGLSKAVDRPLRYALATNPWVSSPRPPGWRGRPTRPT